MRTFKQEFNSALHSILSSPVGPLSGVIGTIFGIIALLSTELWRVVLYGGASVALLLLPPAVAAFYAYVVRRKA